MGSYSISDNDKFFTAKTEDAFNFAEIKNITKFTSFLDGHQQQICKIVAGNHNSVKYFFDGGYENAERKILCVMADYDSRETVEIPIKPVTFTYRSQDTITHRDVLGALMGLGIKRECIGDILVSAGQSVVFALNTAAELICSNIVKIGRIGVKTELGCGDLLQFEQKFTDINGTVSSMRLDSVLSLLIKAGREKAVQLIRSNSVMVNHMECCEKSRSVEAGDIISVRGFGKYKVSAIGDRTKKDRIHIECKKFL